MTEQQSMSDDLHQACARSLFNRVWDLMQTKERTQAQVDEMIHAAHASRYHWGKVGRPVNLARGEWQISRMYSVLGRAEPALHHAARCLEWCESHDIGPFDLGFAHEALARASAVAGDAVQVEAHLRAAREAAEQVEEAATREHLEKELDTLV